jgi:putative ABC transport system permease protein
MDEIVAGSAHDASQTTLLSVLAPVAMLLAVVGLHRHVGVLGSATQIRIRDSSGFGRGPSAPAPHHTLAGHENAVAGILIGTAGAFTLARLLRAPLFSVNPIDPLVFTAVPLLLLLVTLVASYWPARRVSARHW